jgi:hypothetical protein
MHIYATSIVSHSDVFKVTTSSRHGIADITNQACGRGVFGSRNRENDSIYQNCDCEDKNGSAHQARSQESQRPRVRRLVRCPVAFMEHEAQDQDQ